MKINAVLLKPLDGDAEGSEREFDKADFDRLEAMDAVREAKVEKAPANKQERAPANKAAKGA